VTDPLANLIAVRFLSKPWVDMHTIRIANLSVRDWLEESSIPYCRPSAAKSIYFSLPKEYESFTVIDSRVAYFIDLHQDRAIATLNLIHSQHRLRMKAFMTPLSSEEWSILVSILGTRLSFMQQR